MAFDFPTNPAISTIVTTPTGIGYEWDGSVWRTPFSGSGLIDAPSDGNTYGRLNAAWAQVLPLTGGTLTGPLTIGTTPYNATLMTFNPVPAAGNSAIFFNKVQGVHDGDAPQIHSNVYVDYNGGSGAFNHLQLETNITGNPGGNIWALLNQLYVANNDAAGGSAVGYYGQTVRTQVPASSVGVAEWCAVFECRSQTGLSSATDGVMTSVEIDCFANGADDMVTGIGRTLLSLVLGQANTSGAAVEATAGISFYILGGTTGHFKSQIFSTAPYSQAVLDTRNATPTSGAANAIWLGNNQTIALDTAGSGGASNVRLSGDGANAVVTTATGSVAVGGTGIQYSALGGGHNIGFTWSGTAFNGYVDGSNQGALATQGWVNSAYAPLASPTFTGTLTLNGAATNIINRAAVGAGAPTFTTRSAGTKSVYWANVSPSTSDAAVGIDGVGPSLWYSIPQNTWYFRWYQGTTQIAQLDPLGNLSLSGGLTAAAASGVVMGAGGPNIRSGTGAASGTQPKGSLWMRTDGAVGSTLYVSQGAGTWNAVAGV